MSAETVATIGLVVHGMHCGSCALLIDDALADLPGILRSRTSIKTQHSAITHDDRITEARIITAIEGLGYHAEPGPAPS